MNLEGNNSKQVPRGTIKALFPFNAFFSDAPKDKMWSGNSEQEDLDCANGCFRHLEKVFEVCCICHVSYIKKKKWKKHIIFLFSSFYLHFYITLPAYISVQELADFRAFELLRNHKMRSNYLLLKQARIVAMTCTHAAMTRKQLVELGFRYDNLIMEESAQVQ